MYYKNIIPIKSPEQHVHLDPLPDAETPEVVGPPFNGHGGFHKWRCPIAGWFLEEHPIKIYDLGVPPF